MIISLFLVSNLIFGTVPGTDISEYSKRATDYLEATVQPVILKGAEWGVTAGLAVSGVNAFIVVIKKFLDV